MIKSAWIIIGKVAFWLTWPALWVYLRFTTRTRVLVKYQDELLVVQGWLSPGDWMLPGGGLHRGENPRVGASREVKEETTVSLDPSSLIPLLDTRLTTPHGFNFHCLAYGVEIAERPDIKAQRGELITVTWLSIEQLLVDPSVDPAIKPALQAWRQLT